MHKLLLKVALPPACAAFLLATTIPARAQDVPPTPPGVEILNRGPIHEAFAEPTDVVRQTITASQRPPEPIQEIPPVRPEGENALWVNGYWAWSGGAQPFVWVSGIWRVPPPGRSWVPGYWSQYPDGWRWAPGFWAPLNQQTVQYLPPPPDPPADAQQPPPPQDGSFWVRGHWAWTDSGYIWQPGHWQRAEPGWVWTPDTYFWSPTGYVFVNGYWDYPLAARGALFAPVAFVQPVYTQPDFVFTPTVLVDVDDLPFNLFVRPDYCQYYFGDYYDARYAAEGFIPWYAESFHGRPYYDPLFVYQRWEHRHDPRWYDRLTGWHRLLEQHADLRPPHLHSQLAGYEQRIRSQPQLHNLIQQNLHVNVGDFLNRAAVARPINQFRQQSHPYVRLQDVPHSQRQEIASQSRHERDFAQRRMDLEQRNRASGGQAKQARTLQLPTPPHAAQQAARNTPQPPTTAAQAPNARHQVMRPEQPNQPGQAPNANHPGNAFGQGNAGQSPGIGSENRPGLPASPGAGLGRGENQVGRVNQPPAGQRPGTPGLGSLENRPGLSNPGRPGLGGNQFGRGNQPGAGQQPSTPGLGSLENRPGLSTPGQPGFGGNQVGREHQPGRGLNPPQPGSNAPAYGSGIPGENRPGLSNPGQSGVGPGGNQFERGNPPGRGLSPQQPGGNAPGFGSLENRPGLSSPGQPGLGLGANPIGRGNQLGREVIPQQPHASAPGLGSLENRPGLSNPGQSGLGLGGSPFGRGNELGRGFNPPQPGPSAPGLGSMETRPGPQPGLGLGGNPSARGAEVGREVIPQQPHANGLSLGGERDRFHHGR